MMMATILSLHKVKSESSAGVADAAAATSNEKKEIEYPKKKQGERNEMLVTVYC